MNELLIFGAGIAFGCLLVFVIDAVAEIREQRRTQQQTHDAFVEALQRVHEYGGFETNGNVHHDTR